MDLGLSSDSVSLRASRGGSTTSVHFVAWAGGPQNRLIGGMFDRSVRASSAEILGGHGWRVDDDFAARLFMPFKWASISEMVHTGEDLCSTSLAAIMTGGRPQKPSCRW
jgi:hypothetical protein